MNPVHTEEFAVRSYDLGRDRRLRLQALCNYLEESAALHAEILGLGFERLLARGLAWVLVRLRLSLIGLPPGGQRVRVETWPVERDGLRFRRDFLLADEAGRILARAVSHWAMLDLATRRVERMPEIISGIRPENPRRALEDGDIRIPALRRGWDEGPIFPVRLADIDQNRHVNNSRYLDFILEAAEAYGRDAGLAGLDVLFRAEALRGDVIGSRTAPEKSGRTLLHSLYRLSDGLELVRARSVWEGPAAPANDNPDNML
jgi:acyl-ACP thioesterase